MKGFVYIIKSKKNNSYYIGSSTNPNKRFEPHNKGLVGYTKNLVPWELELTQQYADITQARKIEYKLKKLKRRDYLDKIVADGCIRLS